MIFPRESTWFYLADVNDVWAGRNPVPVATTASEDGQAMLMEGPYDGDLLEDVPAAAHEIQQELCRYLYDEPLTLRHGLPIYRFAGFTRLPPSLP